MQRVSRYPPDSIRLRGNDHPAQEGPALAIRIDRATPAARDERSMFALQSIVAFVALVGAVLLSGWPS